MGRRVFISVLGTGNYQECIYQSSDKTVSVLTCFAQEAALLYADAPNWDSADQVFILLTEDARQRNWNKLFHCLSSLGLPCSIKGIPIVDGKDEKEVWSIFKTIYDLIEDGDCLYFDVTHALRYLPMLVLVMGSYTSFLKNTTVNKIVYGNWEMRDKESNVAPLMDLTILNELQRWSFAVGAYLKNGSAKELAALGSKSLGSLCREKNQDARHANSFIKSFLGVIDNWRTNRGPAIIDGDGVLQLREATAELKEEILPPFFPLVERISASMDLHVKNDIRNMYECARWCFQNGLFVESQTLLEEGIITRLCRDIGFDWLNEEMRPSLNAAAQFVSRHSKKGDLETETGLVIELFETISKMGCSEIKQFGTVTELRNDLNHSGMRGNGKGEGKLPLGSNSIEERLGTLLKKFKPFFYHPYSPQKDHLFINYSGSSIKHWNQDEVKRALSLGFYCEFTLPKENEESKIADNLVKQFAKIERLHLSIPPENTLVYFGEYTDLKRKLASRLAELGYHCTDSVV